MSTFVKLSEDFMREAIDVYIGERNEHGYVQHFGDGSVQFQPLSETRSVTEPERSFTIREDHARALLTALIRHFDGGEDTRALRRDYDAERARVDLLIGKLANPVIVADGADLRLRGAS